MSATKIKKSDKAKIAMYMELSGAIVEVRDGLLYISTPEANEIFDSVGDLMENINYNLKAMREVYENNNEMDEWYEALERAVDSEWRF